MSPLTILRIEKLKTFGNVAGSDDHVLRNRDTPNADPTKKNVRLIGGDDERPLEEIVKEKISTLKHPPRKDAVLCTEIFLSASPEYFRPNAPSMSGHWSKERMQQWAISSRDWLVDNYGSKCVRAELHLDESTPHIHAYIVPLNQKTGRVSHDAMFGGRGGQGRIKLSKLQDSYADALAPLGIPQFQDLRTRGSESAKRSGSCGLFGLVSPTLNFMPVRATDSESEAVTSSSG